ncbi:hypothetical protein BCR39DRAFT_478691 [Naematelia encephala]|uniref:Uncharacterized protein n=1 Tax=Naematelia encephala TaxID=71784 RepID=A0A1Y2BCL0_9TREE|nr:hypothetical protein BCR39DRAFT_478691 [Naematelia encephala]
MRRPSFQDPLAPIWSDDKTVTAKDDDEDEYRGRPTLPKRTSLSNDGAIPNLINADSIQAVSFHSHHHLPSPRDEIPSDPILYLPPLLSPLPASVPRRPQDPSTKDWATFETRLPDIDPASLALHQALHHFRPLNSGYAQEDYDKAFNWDELTLPKEIAREWYCVVFRSRRNPESSSLSLYKADREAHEEAVRNGGLVMYWYGVPDETGLNLATCIWQSRRHAVNAISGPKHIQAMKQAKDAYERYDLERWVLSKERGQSTVSLSKWQGGDVGW